MSDRTGARGLTRLRPTEAVGPGTPGPMLFLLPLAIHATSLQCNWPLRAWQAPHPPLHAVQCRAREMCVMQPWWHCCCTCSLAPP